MSMYARTSDPSTSHEAMSKFSARKMGAAMNCVIDIYREHKKLADYELRPLFEKVWGLDCCDHLYQQVRSIARDKGWVVDSGVKIKNPNTNRRQIVWEYCDTPVPMEIHQCETCGHVLRRQGGNSELNGN